MEAICIASNDESDKELIGYAGFLALNLEVEEAIFMFVSRRKRDIPSAVAQSFPELLEPELPRTEMRIKSLFELLLAEAPGVKCRAKTEEGAPLDRFLGEIKTSCSVTSPSSLTADTIGIWVSGEQLRAGGGTDLRDC